MARVSLRKSNFLTRQQLLCLSPCKRVTTNTINEDYKLTASKVAKHPALYNNHYTQRVIQVQSSAIWHVSCSCHLSVNLSSITTWHAKFLCISRRYNYYLLVMGKTSKKILNIFIQIGNSSATTHIPTMTSTQIQRWVLSLLTIYDYETQYRQGSQQANADGCSRLPLPVSFQEFPISGETILVIYRTFMM